MQHIIRYASGHHNTQLVWLSVSEAGIGALRDMQEKLHFAGNELHRMEDESGIPLAIHLATEAEAYLTLAKRIRNLLRRPRPEPSVRKIKLLTITMPKENCYDLEEHRYHAGLIPEYSVDRS